MGSLSLASSVGKIIEQQEGCQMGGWLCGARVGHGRPGGGARRGTAQSSRYRQEKQHPSRLKGESKHRTEAPKGPGHGRIVHNGQLTHLESR